MERGMQDIIRNPGERTPELMDEIMAATEAPGAIEIMAVLVSSLELK